MDHQHERKLSIASRRKMARAAKRTAKKRQLKKKLLAKREHEDRERRRGHERHSTLSTAGVRLAGRSFSSTSQL